MTNDHLDAPHAVTFARMVQPQPSPMDITETLQQQIEDQQRSELIGMADEADAGILTAMRTLKRLREYRNSTSIKLTNQQDVDYGTVAVLMIELERLVRQTN